MLLGMAEELQIEVFTEDSSVMMPKRFGPNIFPGKVSGLQLLVGRNINGFIG